MGAGVLGWSDLTEAFEVEHHFTPRVRLESGDEAGSPGHLFAAVGVAHVYRLEERIVERFNQNQELSLLPADMDVRQWVAYAGLDPREYSSGTSVQKKVRISKAGNKHLRRALYMPALVAVRHQPQVRAYYEHLQARGKTKMQALVATMRKLLHAIYGMFKHDQLFDGHKVYAALDVTATPPVPEPQEVLCP